MKHTGQQLIQQLQSRDLVAQISGDQDEVSLSSNEMTILNQDWNKPFNNQITISGIDDAIIDGDIFLVL